MNLELKSSIPDFSIRWAKEEDTSVIFTFIKELAVYEKMLDQVIATEESLKESIFVKEKAEVIIGQYKGKPVGFALFFHNYSTFIGNATMYLEDLYVQQHMRGMGFGKALILAIAQVALERNCKRMDWACLDWNKSSYKFYESLGAKPMTDWVIFRADEEVLRKL